MIHGPWHTYYPYVTTRFGKGIPKVPDRTLRFQVIQHCVQWLAPLTVHSTKVRSSPVSSSRLWPRTPCRKDSPVPGRIHTSYTTEIDPFSDPSLFLWVLVRTTPPGQSPVLPSRYSPSRCSSPSWLFYPGVSLGPYSVPRNYQYRLTIWNRILVVLRGRPRFYLPLCESDGTVIQMTQTRYVCRVPTLGVTRSTLPTLNKYPHLWRSQFPIPLEEGVGECGPMFSSFILKSNWSSYEWGIIFFFF